MSNMFYDLTNSKAFDKNLMYAKFNFFDTKGNLVEGIYQRHDIFDLIDYLGFALENSEIEIDQSKPINITIIPTSK